MKPLCRFFSILGILCFAFSTFAQESKLVVVSTAPKELKRSAHRLRIPVDQLKKARQTLQEATDLVSKIKPYPAGQIYSLISIWRQLDRSRADSMVNAFIQDLRSEAAKAADPQAYTTATSTAMTIMQSQAEFDYEKLQQMLRTWPEPPASIAEATGEFRKNLETNGRQNALWRMANTDPEKALDLLTSSGDSGAYNYYASGQVVQGLMNAGKQKQAFDLIEKTIGYFNQHATEANALQSYESFVHISMHSLDSGRALAVINPLITQIMGQTSAADCSGSLKNDNTSMDLTCSESKILNLLRAMSMKPGLVHSTLDSMPELKAKLDSVGGIDSIYGGTGTNFVFNPHASRQPLSSEAMIYQDPMKLLESLKGKSESNPGYVKSRLTDAARGQQGLQMLINLAMMSAYQDDALGSLALEVVKQRLYTIAPLQARCMILQSLIATYRQVEGEVDQGLLKDGFILADQLREEATGKSESADEMSPIIQASQSTADNLEASLVAEMSKDSFESAIDYVRAMKNDNLKLTSLLQMAQALSQPNL
jgi:hypothetical protein